MGRRRDDPIEERKRTLMRIATAQASRRFSQSGREKVGYRAPKKPTLPKLPWDDEEKRDER